MPIRPENKARYPKEWAAISAAIRARAGDRCGCEGAPAMTGQATMTPSLRASPSSEGLAITLRRGRASAGLTLTQVMIARNALEA